MTATAAAVHLSADSRFVLKNQIDKTKIDGNIINEVALYAAERSRFAFHFDTPPFQETQN